MPTMNSQNERWVWALCCALAGLVLIGYAAVSISTGRGQPVMPVDDAYIHFQYARQIALGELYVYNPGLPPTSGATSFLYPYVLALGYILGFQGLWLGLWAMGIGALALLASGWTVYLLVRLFVASQVFSVALMTAFMLTGLVSWHFMSGMETGLVICFTLLTFYSFITRQSRPFIIAGVLLALIRPEGGIMTLIAVGLWWLRAHTKFAGTRHASSAGVTLRVLLIPLIAIGIQPLVNLLVAGSASASGNQAKSLFGMIPAYPSEIWRRIFENFERFWVELISGLGREGMAVIHVSSVGRPLFILPPFIGLLAVIGVLAVTVRRKRWDVLLLIIAWLLVISAAISTLDTAFWHFKRYQMPLLALMFPLAGWCWSLVPIPKNTKLVQLNHEIGFGLRQIPLIPLLLLWLMTVLSGLSYLDAYAVNAANVAAQPLAMARWIAENTPDDAVIAVHDVGTLRYIGGRTTLDMVGLTTPGAADWWRNGPGAVGELLIEHQPDYIAAYTSARGLNYLADTSIYGDLLAGFPTRLDPQINVALGGDFQGVFKPTWRGTVEAKSPLQPSILEALAAFDEITLVDQVNVANLNSERAHNYAWNNHTLLPGFATEIYGLYFIDQTGCGVDCPVVDGGRRINGEERFTLETIPNQTVILVTRVHPVNGGTFDVYADGQQVGKRILFSQPGNWLEIATFIPGEFITDTATDVRIVPSTPGGHYMPYFHWAFQGHYQPGDALNNLTASFTNDTIHLQVEPLSYDDGHEIVRLDLQWFTPSGAEGDAKIFVHVYANPDEPPVVQFDGRPAAGTQPPGNWLPGTFADQITLNVSDLPAGQYTVAIGLYDPITETRLLPNLTDSRFTLDEGARRIMLGTFDIKTESSPRDG